MPKLALQILVYMVWVAPLFLGVGGFPFPSPHMRVARSTSISMSKFEAIVDSDDIPKEAPTTHQIPSGDRRYFLLSALVGPLVLWSRFPALAQAEAIPSSLTSIQLPPWNDSSFIESLCYDKVLGQGSFKTVYAVKSSSSISSSWDSLSFAMSVEPLRTKSDRKEALRALKIVQYLQENIRDENDRQLFEQVFTWWIQTKSLAAFVPGQRILQTKDDSLRMTQRPPSNFLGTLWLISIKPLYAMDLKAFIRKATTMIPIGSKHATISPTLSTNTLLPLTEQSALQFALDVCRAGAILHEAGLVHRDIKPKNIMISKEGRPVIIDFGFAQFGSPVADGQRICITEPGKIKGEVHYVLARDVGVYRGCQEGDLYAMGKTLYELYFEKVSASKEGTLLASEKQSITEEAARTRNEQFRAKLNAPNMTVSLSRFELSEHGRDTLLQVIRGLCSEDTQLTFRGAVRILQETMNYL